MTTERGSSLQPEQVAANLAGFQRIAVERSDLKQASVALCVQTAAGGDTLLITRRAQGLRNHAGQWALPGGRRDEGESIQGAALRELREETGVNLGSDAVLGMLDDYVTRSGYLMTPVVAWGGAADGELTAAPAEVARIFRVPLADLDVEPEFLRIPQAPGPVIRLPLFDRYVHAPTAAIIYQFCQVALHGNTLRVAHFEAPVHLWR
ncbi:MAG TPA: CoA pyrophosphatase [Streptosporangiaceae bacterium]|nr:CoA pyrophosphatase [Streptosporangiaceae bacterium]